MVNRYNNGGDGQWPQHIHIYERPRRRLKLRLAADPEASTTEKMLS